MSAESRIIRNLVLGSSGFVGKPFCQYLQTLGEEALPYDIQRSANEDARKAILPLEQVDRVYFLAWDVGGAKYLYTREAQFRQLDWNLRLMLNVMPQLRGSGIPFLFVSSQLAEDNDTVYGATKRLGEVWTHLLGGVLVRLWNVYGPAEVPSERSHVVADFVYQALLSGKIEMLTTGEETRQFIHIDDVCSGIHAALSNQLPGVYDVTSFEWVRVRDVANIVAEITGVKVVPGAKAGSNPTTPIKGKIPGWHSQVNLKEGLEMCVSLGKKVLEAGEGETQQMSTV